MAHIHVGDKVYSMQLRDPNAGLDLVNRVRQAQGQAIIPSDTFQKFPPELQNEYAVDALNFNDPGRGQITPQTLTTLENRLSLVQAQPDFSGKDTL